MIEITATKTYGKKTVLSVDRLTLEEGKFYAIIGANGSGKSTLLRLLDSQLKADVKQVKAEGHTFAYMPQSVYAFSLSVKRNIMLACGGMNRSAAKQRGLYLAHCLGLEDLLTKNAARLSGGETQRVALARTLMSLSNTLLLDEPTAAMDVEQATLAVDLLKREHQRNGNTVIMVTHSFKQAEQLADEILFFSHGKLTERGTPQELLNNPQTAEARAFINFNG